MTPTAIPPGFEDIAADMRAAHTRIMARLHELGYAIPDYPVFDAPGNPRGRGAARAHPMQGILKYHGLADWRWRTAYLPSISVTNDAAYSLTTVEFDPALPADTVMLGGKTAGGREAERVTQTLDAVRAIARIDSRAAVRSHNVVKGGKAGKGLGTSASGSAALAMAAVIAAFGPEAAPQSAAKNGRFVTSLARLLAGSGCRSAAGGVALWLSYPGIAHEDSFALRLDTRNELVAMRLMTIPLDSRIGLKTEQAHHDAPRSAFFKPWMRQREAEILRAIAAAHGGDWLTLAQQAEHDSIYLHGVTMSGGNESKIFAWEPENLTLFRLCDDLRAEGVPVYFSTDTGPTMVLLTAAADMPHIAARVRGLGFDCVEGDIAPGAHGVDYETALRELRTAKR
jgi:diphosphomevalonate decarboxylase